MYTLVIPSNLNGKGRIIQKDQTITLCEVEGSCESDIIILTVKAIGHSGISKKQSTGRLTEIPLGLSEKVGQAADHPNFKAACKKHELSYVTATAFHNRPPKKSRASTLKKIQAVLAELELS